MYKKYTHFYTQTNAGKHFHYQQSSSGATAGRVLTLFSRPDQADPEALSSHQAIETGTRILLEKGKREAANHNADQVTLSRADWCRKKIWSLMPYMEIPHLHERNRSLFFSPSVCVDDSVSLFLVITGVSADFGYLPFLLAAWSTISDSYHFPSKIFRSYHEV